MLCRRCVMAISVHSASKQDSPTARKAPVAGMELEDYGIHRAAALHGGVLCFAARVRTH